MTRMECRVCGKHPVSPLDFCFLVVDGHREWFCGPQHRSQYEWAMRTLAALG